MHNFMLHASKLIATMQFQGSCGLVAMTSASHAEGRQFDPGQVYFSLGVAARSTSLQTQDSNKLMARGFESQWAEPCGFPAPDLTHSATASSRLAVEY